MASITRRGPFQFQAIVRRKGYCRVATLSALMCQLFRVSRSDTMHGYTAPLGGRGGERHTDMHAARQPPANLRCHPHPDSHE
jgi:hypothetical protein